MRVSALAVPLKKKVWSAADLTLHRREISLMEDLSAFVPNSAGDRRQLARLTLQSARQTFPLLAQLACDLRGEKGILPVEDFSRDECARVAARRLKTIFDKHGSDKASVHDYHHLYGAILTDANATMDILEVGLGTNNTSVVSNMGKGGIPGASLRAFREFLPNARIYGADVDSSILFEEDRIKTFFVDQTDYQSFIRVAEMLGHKFDMIIDDGLHAPNANIATLVFALQNLKSNGWFIVEDIALAALPIWHVVAALIPAENKCWLISAKGGHLFVVRKGAV